MHRYYRLPSELQTIITTAFDTSQPPNLVQILQDSLHGMTPSRSTCGFVGFVPDQRDFYRPRMGNHNTLKTKGHTSIFASLLQGNFKSENLFPLFKPQSLQQMNVLERARASGKCPPSLFLDEPKEGSFETAVAKVLDANGTSCVRHSCVFYGEIFFR